VAIKTRLTNVPDAVWVCRTGNWEVELHFSAIFYAHLESHTEPRIRGRRTPSAAVSKAMQAKIKNQRSEEWLENKRLNNFFFFLTQRENGNGKVWKRLGNGIGLSKCRGPAQQCV